MSKVALILINLGSPDSFEKNASKEFIYNMLSDKRILNMPFPFRQIIAKLAASKGAEPFLNKLKKVAIEGRSPLRHYTTSLREKLAQRMSMHTLTAYRYCGPKIDAAVSYARRKGYNEFVFIPLYPQYSISTTQSARDEVERVMSVVKRPWSFCEYYCDNQVYLNSIYKSAKNAVDKSDALLVSFHSIPKKESEKSIYEEHCLSTMKYLADKFPDKRVEISWHSAMSNKGWLRPSAEEVTMQMLADGVKNLAVICPGFAIDCTETLIDIDTNLRNLFMSNGGNSFEYIKCLNDSDLQIDVIENLFYQYE